MGSISLSETAPLLYAKKRIRLKELHACTLKCLSVAEVAAEEIVPLVVVAFRGHAGIRLGAAAVQILGAFIQRNGKGEGLDAPNHGDGGGIPGLEAPQSPGQAGHAGDLDVTDTGDNILWLNACPVSRAAVIGWGSASNSLQSST